MTRNLGDIDRILRILVGIGAIAFALVGSHPLAMLGYIGIVPLVTGLIGWCPAYLPFGLKTCKARKA